MKPRDEPRRVADQLGSFVEEVKEVANDAARSSTVPEERDVLDRLSSSMSDAVAALQRAAEALEAGKGNEADAVVNEQFTKDFQEADNAAMEYGMPHLTECDESLHPASPNGSATSTTPTSPPSDEPPVGWRSGADLPIAVQQLGSAVVDGTIWVAGGLTGDSDGVAAEVQGLDPAIDTWKSAPPLPIKLHHAMAVSYQGRLVVLGGWMPQGGQLPGVESDQVFVLGDEGWTELSRMNHRRVAGAAAVVGDKIVVVGGQADEELVTTTEVFDGSAWIERADMPTPREHVAAATDGRYLYAVGGRTLSSSKNLDALERYDPEKNQWTRLTQMPTARGGLGAAVVDDRLVAVGGEHSTGVFGTVEAYDIASDTWSPLAELKTPRHGLAVAAVGNSLYAIGGADKPSHTSSTPTVEILAFS